jgi:hypothetical protein
MYNYVTSLALAMWTKGRRYTDVSQKKEGTFVWETAHDVVDDDYYAADAVDDDYDDDDTNTYFALKVDKLWLLEKASCKADKLLPLIPSFM